MNLDLGVLWIEDNFDLGEKHNLERRVRDAGFIARIDVLKNGDGIDELSRIHKLYHSYDIILLDYQLKDDNGAELAPRVRELFPFTNILFYSGSVDEQQLRDMIAQKKVDGVYCSARERFIERTGALIDQTARALERLSGMRGLAMKVVAECDSIMKSAILSMCNRDPNCRDNVNALDDDVLGFISDMKEKYEAAISEDLNSRLATRAVDSAKLFKHFRRLTRLATRAPETFGLDELKVERLRELRRLSSEYDQKVLKKRNILGHVVEVQREAGWILEGSDEISIVDFPEIRRVFANHIDFFREMSGLVNALDAQ